jgi:hypothetical protein
MPRRVGCNQDRPNPGHAVEGDLGDVEDRYGQQGHVASARIDRRIVSDDAANSTRLVAIRPRAKGRPELAGKGDSGRPASGRQLGFAVVGFLAYRGRNQAALV